MLSELLSSASVCSGRRRLALWLRGVEASSWLSSAVASWFAAWPPCGLVRVLLPGSVVAGV